MERVELPGVSEEERAALEAIKEQDEWRKEQTAKWAVSLLLTGKHVYRDGTFRVGQRKRNKAARRARRANRAR